MLAWLEMSCQINGMRRYYDAVVADYAHKPEKRGVGLELVLEYVLPDLVKPKLEIAFDSDIGRYTVDLWDRELLKKPISVVFTNKTRGFISVAIDLKPASIPKAGDALWLGWLNSQVISCRPGEPASREIRFFNPFYLKRRRTYRCYLHVSIEGIKPVVQKIPITLKTMSFFQGLHGMLWLWGLLGDIPGFAWNFALGLLMAFIFFWFIVNLTPAHYLQNQVLSGFSLQETAASTAMMFQLLGLRRYIFLVAGITGVLGYWIGIDQVHKYGNLNQSISSKAWAWLKTGCGISLILIVVLIIWVCIGVPFANQPFLYSKASRPLGNIDSVLQAYLFGGCISAGGLTFVIICIIVFIRSRFETHLYHRYRALRGLVRRWWVYDI